jgi:hypothetical protein
MMSKSKNCPICATEMRPALYGMPNQDDFESGKYLIMGCLMDEDPVRFGCPNCGSQVLASGVVFNPNDISF